MKIVENKDKNPKDGRWNFEENRWEERKGKRNEKTKRIDWGPWMPSKKKAPEFSEKAVAKRLKYFRDGLALKAKAEEIREKQLSMGLEENSPEVQEFKRMEDEAEEEIHSNVSYSICGIGKHFHKSNSAVKKKIRSLVAKVVGDDKKAQKIAYDSLTEGIPDYTPAEAKERAKQKDQSFLAKDITDILGITIFEE